MKRWFNRLSTTTQYVIAGICLIASLGAFSESTLSGILVLLAALIICPYIRYKTNLFIFNCFYKSNLTRRDKFKGIRGWRCFLLASTLFITGVMASPTDTDTKGPNNDTHTLEWESANDIHKPGEPSFEFEWGTDSFYPEESSEVLAEEETKTTATEETVSFVEEPESETEIYEMENNSAPSADTPSEMEVHFIDVGQGDATLIKADDKYMLIDAADNTKGSYVWSYLRKQGVNKLDYLILTHTDADHIGGADVIVTKFDIDTVFIGDFKKDNKTYEELMDALEYKRLSYCIPNVGNTYRLANAEFTILAPNREYDNPNDTSIALLFQNGNNRFLFTGDARADAESDILANGLDIACDVYKAGHHGSSSSTTEAFFNKVKPTYAVISCAEGNEYGHPHAEVLNILRSGNVFVFRTDEQGSIIAYSDGTNITFNCAPSDTWKAGEKKVSEVTHVESETNDVSNVVETPDTQEQAPIVENTAEQIVGNKNSKVFHRSTCSHLPKEKNRVYLDTREDALAAGFDNPCDYCNP